jgi:hypothetical protein
VDRPKAIILGDKVRSCQLAGRLKAELRLTTFRSVI